MRISSIIHGLVETTPSLDPKSIPLEGPTLRLLLIPSLGAHGHAPLDSDTYPACPRF